jgi:DNA polymerase III alpha subunit (gram-positive type)
VESGFGRLNTTQTILLLQNKMDKLNINQRIFFCDTETESLNLDTSRPWEFAWVEMLNGNVIDSQSRYIWWEDLNISADAARVTGFDPEKYAATAIAPEEVYDEIKEWFFDDVLLGFHNGLNFDVYQIRNWFREIKKPTDFDWVKRVVDTNALAKALKSNSKPDKENFDAWQYRWINFVKRGLKTNVTALCKEYNIEIDETKTHQGDYDCFLTAQIYKKLAYSFQES